MSIETIQNISGNGNVVISFERIDSFQISKLHFVINDSHLRMLAKRSMVQSKIHFLIDGTWETKYKNEKDTNYGATTTEWTLINLDFTEINYGIELIND